MLLRIKRLTPAQIIASIALLFGVLAIAAFGFMSGSQANASTAGGPFFGLGNAYYESPILGCVKIGDESTAYTEQHSFTQSNCASGYAQIALNTPWLPQDRPFQLYINDVSYTCNVAIPSVPEPGDTEMEITQIGCSTTNPTSTSSPSP